MQQFVKAAQAGDEKAWNILYRHNYPWLYATALKAFGNSTSAKDVIQDTFIQAYLKLSQLKDAKAFPAWIKTILYHNCIHNRYINQPALNKNLVPLKEDHFWEDKITQEQEKAALQTRLYGALNLLSEPLQSALILRYFSQWNSYEQIATILSVPVGTVRSRLNQARQKLNEFWHQSHPENEDAISKADEWNYFYTNCFTSLHHSLVSREHLISHLDKQLQLVFTSGNTAYGREIIEKEIADDLTHGNSFNHIQVTSSGCISLVEVRNINSADYPKRCPDSGIFVLYRKKNKTIKMRLHNSQ